MESINQTVGARCLLRCFMNVYVFRRSLQTFLCSIFFTFYALPLPCIYSRCMLCYAPFSYIFILSLSQFYKYSLFLVRFVSFLCHDEFRVISCFCLLVSRDGERTTLVCLCVSPVHGKEKSLLFASKKKSAKLLLLFFLAPFFCTHFSHACV